MPPNFHFNLLFFKRFFLQLQVIFPRCFCSSMLLFVILIGVLIIEQIAVYFVGLMPSKYYAILGEKDFDAFLKQTAISTSLVVAMAIILAVKKFVWTLFYIKSREMLSKLLQKLYTSNINFYKINVLEVHVDNVDQRISQDVDKMCRIFGEIIPSLLVTPFNILYYTYATWTVTGYVGPLSTYVFFVVSTTVNKFLMSPIVSLTAEQEKQEGEFRYKHMHLRHNSESAAFYRCGSTENVKLDQKLESLFFSQRKLNSGQFFLSLSVHSASYFGSILSYIVIAVPIFRGIYDDLSPSDLSALISKASFLILYLIYNFTRLIELAPEVANMAGCSHRVGELLETLLRMEREDKGEELAVVSGANNNPIEECAPRRTAYLLNRVTINVASKACRYKLLCKDLSLEIATGCNLLITGDSGIGKTSLLRTLDGLWPLHSGRIVRSMSRGRNGIFHLPQKPYLTNGSLREQIVFPDSDLNSATDDEEILAHLRKARLEDILVRAGSLDNKLDWRWEEVLSPGEAQRLAFVRLFCHRPSLAVLDEATSQISEDLEAELYKHCILLGMTLVSIGHRRTLVKFHDQELRLFPGGDWRLVDLGQGEWTVDDGQTAPDVDECNGGVANSFEPVQDMNSETEVSNVDEARQNLLGYDGSTRL